MVDTSTSILVAPVVEALQPLVSTAVSATIAGIVGLVIALYNSWRLRLFTIDAAHTQLIKDAAANEARKILAGFDTKAFANAKITVDSPLVVAAVNSIIGADAKNLKQALAATGATPELIASFITGAIGNLQAQLGISG